MTADDGAQARDGGTEPERIARLEAIVARLEVSVGEVRAEQGRMGETLTRLEVEQARTVETLIRLEVMLDANNKLLERTVQQLNTVTERIDRTISDNARRNDDTNRRVDRLMYGMWGLAAIGFGALAALITELLLR